MLSHTVCLVQLWATGLGKPKSEGCLKMLIRLWELDPEAPVVLWFCDMTIIMTCSRTQASGALRWCLHRSRFNCVFQSSVSHASDGHLHFTCLKLDQGMWQGRCPQRFYLKQASFVKTKVNTNSVCCGGVEWCTRKEDDARWMLTVGRKREWRTWASPGELNQTLLCQPIVFWANC